MTHTTYAPLIGPEFDKFLGAPIGVGRNGTTVSMLSALARLNVDPWQEAAALARMPQETAKMRLTALIAALPRESLDVICGEAVAGDLVALLPRVAAFRRAAPPEIASADPGAQRAQARFVVGALAIVVAIAVVLSLGAPPKGMGAGPSPAVGEHVPTVSSR